MNAPALPAQLDRGLKLCKDCAHQIAGSSPEFDRCGRSVKVNWSTGVEGYFFCEVERESLRDASCGEPARHFTPSADYEAKRSVRRMQNQRAIEDAIMALNPDVSEMQDIFAAITATLKNRYEEKALDALGAAKDFHEALEELERTL